MNSGSCGARAIGSAGVAALDDLPLTSITQSPGFCVRASEKLGEDVLTIYGQV
jgi:diaminohydroxyphosphoribosylaminopyrimidine deaminase / 5-amino-6-(5-phosphoribosylamino)uracil reductase